MGAVNVSLAAFPRLGFVEAMELAQAGVSEPLLGALGTEHVQCCPQNRGILTEELAGQMKDAFPATRFRLHANVRVLVRRQVVDLDRFDATDPYWQALARVSRVFDAPAYTAHAGLRTHATLDQVLDNTRRASDLMGCVVGVEGHYPTPRGIYLLDSWSDYRTMLESGVPYALDLSHLNIVATQSGSTEMGLVQELLSSENCIECHLSANNGSRDAHLSLSEPPWWWPLLAHTNDQCVTFSEGAQGH